MFLLKNSLSLALTDFLLPVLAVVVLLFVIDGASSRVAAA